MVTRLQRFSRDPNGLGRGAGLYYLRGGKRKDSKNHTYTMPNGEVKTIKGPYYSKYSKDRDRATKSTGWRQNLVGRPPKLANKFAHVTDGDISKRYRR